jgi:hypothetical protein
MGQGLQQGAQAAQQTGADYRDMAYKGYQMKQQADETAYGRQRDASQDEWRNKQFDYGVKRDGINDQWAQAQRQHEQSQWQQEEAKRKQWDDYVSTLPPEQQGMAKMFPDKYAQQNLEKQFNTGGGAANGMAAQVEERRAIAQQMGITPDSPAYQSYVMTGKMPREDQSPLTATDKKAILEGDEAVAANQQAIDVLESVLTPGPDGKSLNDKAGYGATASAQSWTARNDPTGFFDDATGEATTELDNAVIGSALANLKSIFGGNPTEGERKILLEMQGSTSKSPQERALIYKRAIEASRKRLLFNQQRATSLRGQDYYKPGGAPGQAQPVPTPMGGNGNLRQKYGLE